MKRHLQFQLRKRTIHELHDFMVAIISLFHIDSFHHCAIVFSFCFVQLAHNLLAITTTKNRSNDLHNIHSIIQCTVRMELNRLVAFVWRARERSQGKYKLQKRQNKIVSMRKSQGNRATDESFYFFVSFVNVSNQSTSNDQLDMCVCVCVLFF